MKGYKTIVFAVLLAAFSAALVVMPTLQAVLSPTMYGYLLMGVSVAVAVLRAITTTPLGANPE
jgi:hypothetical protein